MKLFKKIAVLMLCVCSVASFAQNIEVKQQSQVNEAQSGQMGLAASLDEKKSQALPINSATAEELAEALNGIGIVKAQAIVEFRETNGAFLSAEELTQVKGVGKATVAKNQGLINFSE